MSVPLPHRYTVFQEWEAAQAQRLLAPPRPDILAGPPPQFGGRDDWWSPEHLLLSSLLACLAATFQAVIARARLEVPRYRARAEGVLDKTASGLAFTSITVEAEIEAAGADVERAERLLYSAKTHCIVGNSLKTPVELRVVTRALAPG
jgi:organic hydroperoxide reductase OsmC/OhrA